MFSIQSPGHGWHCTARDSCLAAHTARPNQRLTHPACSQKRMGPLIAYTAGQTQQQPAADQQWQPARRQILSAGCSCCFGLLSLNQNSTASANEGYKFSYGKPDKVVLRPAVCMKSAGCSASFLPLQDGHTMFTQGSCVGDSPSLTEVCCWAPQL